MTVLVRELPAEELSTARHPRNDLVAEEADGADRFTARAGPFEEYERTVVVADDGRITESIRYELAPVVWEWLLGRAYRMALRRRPRPGHTPWWSPPEAPDRQGCTALGTLCYLGLVFGFIGTLLTQTITFAADEFDASKADQGAVLSLVRIGVLGALVVTSLADRRGRRRVLLWCATAGVLLAALSSLSPDLASLGLLQTLVRGCATAGGVLVGIAAAEEMPAGSRAFSFSLLAAAGAFGAGLCLLLLPLADTSDRGWRLVMAAAVLLLPLVRIARAHLPESRRFDAKHADAEMAGHGSRFWLLAVSALLLALFTAPASQLLNEFLRDEQGFAAWQITVFTLVTNTPGGIGLVLGGRLADTRGRRPVGAFGVAAGTLLTVAMVVLGGWPMWGLSVAAAITGAMVVPAISVYGPELFPTSLRGRANGVIALTSLAGSAVGLSLAGWLADAFDHIG
ncbi:MAG: MFS transporter, partial [Acidimicrobiales bacterium]